MVRFVDASVRSLSAISSVKLTLVQVNNRLVNCGRNRDGWNIVLIVVVDVASLSCFTIDVLWIIASGNFRIENERRVAIHHGVLRSHESAHKELAAVIRMRQQFFWSASSKKTRAFGSWSLGSIWGLIVDVAVHVLWVIAAQDFGVVEQGRIAKHHVVLLSNQSANDELGAVVWVGQQFTGSACGKHALKRINIMQEKSWIEAQAFVVMVLWMVTIWIVKLNG